METHASTEVIRAALARSAGGRAPTDRAALERLYERYTPRLLSYIRIKIGRRLREKMESRDILQATLLKSFQHLDEFRGADGRALMAWLARIAEREIVDRADFHGRQKRDAASEAPIDDHQDVAARMRSALSQLIVSEQAAQVEAAMESLSDGQREIILLRKFEELSFPEIASRLGKSEDACRMSFARAMTALTLKLSERS
ncbi:MAG TPA: sigma-70 family RNA polymerase sigma factor [Vicinamibacterales bacterium]|nr:sigma-70 family RNA polymerase sigma factor [Vicinamibacterales bacterium]